MRFLVQRAGMLGKEEIIFAMPADHPFGFYCRGLGCEIRIRYPRNGEFMGLILDRPAFMSGLAKGMDFSPRIKSLCARLEDAALLQLALGFQEAADLIRNGRLRDASKRQHHHSEQFHLSEFH